MQQIAAQNNLAETAYIIPKGKDYAISWFTPSVEVDLCGHATLASAHILFSCLGYDAEELFSFQKRCSCGFSGDGWTDYPGFSRGSPVKTLKMKG